MPIPDTPIKPSEVVALKKNYIPGFVFQGFNSCIAKHYNNGYASFTQDQVIEEIIKQWRLSIDLDTEVTRDLIFQNKWLDVEGVYREQGWMVEYDAPGYNESYSAKFTFKTK
jgi:hypothetical protein